ncbi:MAG: hypothetical protein ACR2IA_10900 [Pyrinomonadaceae bacterium]
MKKASFTIFGIFGFIVFSQLNIFACSCPTVSGLEDEIKWKLIQLQAIFSGEIVEINKIPHTRDISIKVKVEKIWKGVLFEELNVTTPESPGSCGVTFEIGKSYLIFSSLSDEGNLTTGLCLKNKELEKAENELKILGEGKKPRRNKPSNSFKTKRSFNNLLRLNSNN